MHVYLNFRFHAIINKLFKREWLVGYMMELMKNDEKEVERWQLNLEVTC